MELLQRDYIQNLYNTSSDPEQQQMLCFQCEEYISRSAHSCPYCKTAVSPSPEQELAPHKSKVTSLNSHKAKRDELHKNGVASSWYSNKSDDFSSEENPIETETTSSAPMIYILSLLALIIGSSFLFLGTLLPLVSTDGVVTLVWNESLWIPFILFGIALMYCGYRLLQKVEPFF